MRTFSKFLESANYNQQLQALVHRQQKEMEQLQGSGDVNAMLQMMSRHQDELKAFKAQMPQHRPEILSRPHTPVPDELNIDKLLRRR